MNNNIITLIQEVDKQILESLSIFIEKKLSYIWCHELKTSLYKNDFQVTDHCLFKFHEKDFIIFFEISPNHNISQLLGSISGLTIKVTRIKKPSFNKIEEANSFYSHLYPKKLSVIEMDDGEALYLKQIIFFGYSAKGEFKEDDFEELPSEKYYEVKSIEGLILKFENQKELIITMGGRDDFFLSFKDEIDENRPAMMRNLLGWRSQVRYKV